MKKLFTTEEYKLRQLRLHKLWLKKIRLLNEKNFDKKRDGQTSTGRSSQEQHHNIVAPTKFSVVNNISEVVRFYNELNQGVRTLHHVRVDLTKITIIRSDAILGLLALAVKYKAAKLPFTTIHPPKGSSVATYLDESAYTKVAYSTRIGDLRAYDFPSGKVFVGTKADKLPDSKLTADLIEEVTEFLTGQKEIRSQGLQRLFIELMANTNNHASMKKGDQHWWLSIRKNKEKRKVEFTFLDFGLGILNTFSTSVNSPKFKKRFLNILKPLSLKSKDQLLRAIFNCQMVDQSRTNELNRGNGLASVTNVAIRNQVSNLHVITNNVHGDISQNRFEKLAINFPGTFYYWELTEENLGMYGKENL